jgi:hypothetical protein
LIIAVIYFIGGELNRCAMADETLYYKYWGKARRKEVGPEMKRFRNS